jgi:YidC/Oxa1 family membrane protein insertase
MAFFANLFGYLLNFIYNIIGNYGWAIIVFTIVIKLIMIPLSIKQQKSLKKNNKLQAKMKEIQFKYKNDPERLNQATMQLYKEENVSPFSGCFSAIIQLVLLISIFYLVRSPLTHMKKIDTNVVNNYYEILKEENLSTDSGYPEIEIIRETETLKNIENEKINLEEIQKIETNMEFLGLDLSQIPSKNTSDWRVFIIPVLYVVVSFISMKISLGTQNKKKIEDKNLLNEDNSKSEDNSNQDEKEQLGDMQDVMEQTNKNMSMVFPIMYLSIAIIAPLGLALYWLVNSLLMIAERLILNKVIKDDE